MMTATIEAMRNMQSDASMRRLMHGLQRWAKKNARAFALKEGDHPLPEHDIEILSPLDPSDGIEQVLRENLPLLLTLLPKELTVVHRSTLVTIADAVSPGGFQSMTGEMTATALEQSAMNYVEALANQAAHDRERKARLTRESNSNSL